MRGDVFVSLNSQVKIERTYGPVKYWAGINLNTANSTEKNVMSMHIITSNGGNLQTFLNLDEIRQLHSALTVFIDLMSKYPMTGLQEEAGVVARKEEESVEKKRREQKGVRVIKKIAGTGEEPISDRAREPVKD